MLCLTMNPHNQGNKKIYLYKENGEVILKLICLEITNNQCKLGFDCEDEILIARQKVFNIKNIGDNNE